VEWNETLLSIRKGEEEVALRGEKREIMENGEWRMGNGGWRMEDGGWRMEDGECEI
jgi:hypothetical protein